MSDTIRTEQSPAAPAVVPLNAAQLQFLRETLDSAQDEGPLGEGWASPQLVKLREIVHSWLPAHALPPACGGGGVMGIDLHALPSWPQSQDSLAAQMSGLIQVANRLGLYDAADAVKQMAAKLDQVKYGCHLDLYDLEEPDECVIDTGAIHNCIYAKEGMRKEQCKYWRIVALPQGEVQP